MTKIFFQMCILSDLTPLNLKYKNKEPCIKLQNFHFFVRCLSDLQPMPSFIYRFPVGDDIRAAQQGLWRHSTLPMAQEMCFRMPSPHAAGSSLSNKEGFSQLPSTASQEYWFMCIFISNILYMICPFVAINIGFNGYIFLWILIFIACILSIYCLT